MDKKNADATITGWVARELAFWRLRRIQLSFAQERWNFYNETNPNLFLFHFDSGRVVVANKPAGLAPGEHTLIRSEKYRVFFESLRDYLPTSFNTTVAMGVADKVGFVPDVPVFGFQKRRGAHILLLPDIEFLLKNFYESPLLRDTVPFEEKLHSAIFVGGTSGGMISADVARRCGLPRLRSARFFQGNAQVEFILPRIVQVLDNEARAVLEALPYCQHGTKSWSDQLNRRFIISMDGNGASCSRIVIALHSNSVLLKYASEEVLYYFEGLIPWIHYIPVERDEEVEQVLNLDTFAAYELKNVAQQGKLFAEQYLTKNAVLTYAAKILEQYQGCFS